MNLRKNHRTRSHHARRVAVILLACIALALAGCGHATGNAATSTSAPTIKPGNAPAIASAAATATWNAAHWYALMQQVPTPPATLAQARGLLGMQPRDPQQRNSEYIPVPTGAALQQSRTVYHAAFTRLATGAGATPVAPAGAQEFAKRMQNATQQQKVALAMAYTAQMQAANSPSAGNIAGARAGAELQSYVIRQRDPIARVLTGTRQAIASLRAENAARHQALDASQQQAYLKCPRPATCGDTSDCSPYPACVNALNAKLPALVASQQQVAQGELAGEHAAFANARAELEPIFEHAATLMAAAEHAGAAPSTLQQARTTFLGTAGRLQLLDADVVMRAGFWQAIQPKPVAPDYLAQVPAFYAAKFGNHELTSPPTELPKNW